MNELTGRAIEYVRALFCTNAGGHDVEHTMRVYRNTLRIAEEEHAFLEEFLDRYREETEGGGVIVDTKEKAPGPPLIPAVGQMAR